MANDRLAMVYISDWNPDDSFYVNISKCYGSDYTFNPEGVKIFFKELGDRGVFDYKGVEVVTEMGMLEPPYRGIKGL